MTTTLIPGWRLTTLPGSAVDRMAERLHELTGWEIFPEIPTDREYVSRLWAEDWDSPEDSAGDGRP